MKEGLRVQPPSSASMLMQTTKDTKLGKYNFLEGDLIFINFQALGHNPAEWQRPTEFLPERFDHESPLSLTPTGKKRWTTSLIPFHGGNRVCFGKTLAEANLKVLITYIT